MPSLSLLRERNRLRDCRHCGGEVYPSDAVLKVAAGHIVCVYHHACEGKPPITLNYKQRRLLYRKGALDDWRARA